MISVIMNIARIIWKAESSIEMGGVARVRGRSTPRKAGK
jgi:hypothetical protein